MFGNRQEHNSIESYCMYIIHNGIGPNCVCCQGLTPHKSFQTGCAHFNCGLEWSPKKYPDQTRSVRSDNFRNVCEISSFCSQKSCFSFEIIPGTVCLPRLCLYLQPTLLSHNQFPQSWIC